jgi:hypothetical protein
MPNRFVLLVDFDIKGGWRFDRPELPGSRFWSRGAWRNRSRLHPCVVDEDLGVWQRRGAAQNQGPAIHALGVWSRHLMDRIQDESIWLGSPAFADELIGRQPAESLQSTGVVIRVDEIREMSRRWPWSSE